VKGVRDPETLRRPLVLTVTILGDQRPWRRYALYWVTVTVCILLISFIRNQPRYATFGRRMLRIGERIQVCAAYIANGRARSCITVESTLPKTCLYAVHSGTVSYCYVYKPGGRWRNAMERRTRQHSGRHITLRSISPELAFNEMLQYFGPRSCRHSAKPAADAARVVSKDPSSSCCRSET